MTLEREISRVAQKDPGPTMDAAKSTEPVALPQRDFSPLAGLLSYLVPGLGQIIQGRIGKGALFFFSLYGLFFFGQYLGQWRNIYVFDSAAAPRANAGRGKLLEAVADRARFFAQFWIGAAAWPAIIQHFTNPQPADESQPEVPHPYLGVYQLRPR